MQLNDLLASQAVQVFFTGHFLSQDITYAPGGVNATTIRAIVDIGTTMQISEDENGTKQEMVKTATITVPTGNYSVNDEFTFDSTSWKLNAPSGGSSQKGQGVQVLNLICITDYEVGKRMGGK